jgi:hypothetical protein
MSDEATTPAVQPPAVEAPTSPTVEPQTFEVRLATLESVVAALVERADAQESNALRASEALEAATGRLNTLEALATSLAHRVRQLEAAPRPSAAPAVAAPASLPVIATPTVPVPAPRPAGPLAAPMQRTPANTKTFNPPADPQFYPHLKPPPP